MQKCGGGMWNKFALVLDLVRMKYKKRDERFKHNLQSIFKEDLGMPCFSTIFARQAGAELCQGEGGGGGNKFIYNVSSSTGQLSPMLEGKICQILRKEGFNIYLLED